MAGTVAAVTSMAQYALGVMLAGWALPDYTADHTAGRVSLLWQALNRLDGVKMLMLAVLAAATVALGSPTGLLPRGLRWASLALAVSITVSGVGYLFLLQALAPVAYVSGVALLAWVTGVGAALGRTPRRGSHRASLRGWLRASLRAGG